MNNRLPFANIPRRIAVFRALYLGDLLLAVPALRALRSRFPNAEITLIGLPWAASFASRYSRYLDRFVEFPGYPGIGEVPVVPARTKRFLDEQRAYGYDLVIQMHGSGETSNAFVLALDGKASVGFHPGALPCGLTMCARYPEQKPEVERNLDLVALLGCSDRDPELEFPLTGEDRAAADTLLHSLPEGRRSLIGLHVGASRPSRRWPAEYFAAVADELAWEWDAGIILTGGPGEEPLVQAVVQRMKTRPLNLAGKTSIGTLAAIISRLDLFISNDTGPAHLAGAVHTPSITIFGPTDPRRWAPLDRWNHPIVRHPVGCSPCAYRECPIDHRCLRRISPQEVSAVAKQLLARNNDNATSEHSHLAHSW